MSYRIILVLGLSGCMTVAWAGGVQAGSRHASVVLAAAAGQAGIAAAADTQESDETEAGGAGAATDLPVWTPRVDRGAPAAREGGASRGQSDELTVRTLVPRIDEAALSMSTAPTLYWSVSRATPHTVNFTLLAPDAIDPIVDVDLEGPFAAGVHAISLADHGVELAPGTRYEWFVAVVPEADRRSADTLARGVILRVDDEAVRARVADASGEAVTLILARAGLWYDALAAARHRVDADPRSATARAFYAALLEQAGLPVD